MVLSELYKLSTNTPGVQALISEMHRQNETTQKLITELRDQKAFSSERNLRSFSRHRDSFQEQHPRYEQRSSSLNRQRDGRQNPRSDSYDRQDRRFAYQPWSQSFDRNRGIGNDTRHYQDTRNDVQTMGASILNVVTAANDKISKHKPGAMIETDPYQTIGHNLAHFKLVVTLSFMLPIRILMQCRVTFSDQHSENH